MEVKKESCTVFMTLLTVSDIFSRQKIVDEQMAVKRFADAAIDLYACLAVMSRASRSMSIGLRNAEHEVARKSLPPRGGAQIAFAVEAAAPSLPLFAESKQSNQPVSAAQT